MNANIKRIAAIGSTIALVVVSGCTSFDVTVANDDEGNSMPAAANGQDILRLMHVDSQGGE
jgi:hypothetical protein